MKIFKYDFDGEKFVKVSFDAKNQLDLSNAPKSNLIYGDSPYFVKESRVDRQVDFMNHYLVNEITEESNEKSGMVKKCKDCGHYFIIDYSGWLWFKNKNLCVPTHCIWCRIKRRDARKEKRD